MRGRIFQESYNAILRKKSATTIFRIPGREIWHKILWNTYKILEYVRSLTRIWQKIVVAEILDQVSQSDSWKIVHINKIFQESDSATWSKISETTIFVRFFVGSYTII